MFHIKRAQQTITASATRTGEKIEMSSGTLDPYKSVYRNRR